MHHYRILTAALCLLLSAPLHATLVGETETNDSFATAQNLNGNFSTDTVANIFDSTTVPHASVAGNIGGPNGNNDVDYYQFNVPTAGSTGYFDIDDASGVTGGLFDSFLSLFDSGFNVLGIAQGVGSVFCNVSIIPPVGDPGSPITLVPFIRSSQRHL